jgi:hypothetical protein
MSPVCFPGTASSLLMEEMVVVPFFGNERHELPIVVLMSASLNRRCTITHGVRRSEIPKMMEI